MEETARRTRGRDVAATAVPRAYGQAVSWRSTPSLSVPPSDSPQALWDRVTAPGFRALDQWEAFLQARLCLHADLHIYADGLSDEDIRMAMMVPCRDIEATLRELVARHGPRLCVLPQGPMTIPYLG